MAWASARCSIILQAIITGIVTSIPFDLIPRAAELLFVVVMESGETGPAAMTQVLAATSPDEFVMEKEAVVNSFVGATSPEPVSKACVTLARVARVDLDAPSI